MKMYLSIRTSGLLAAISDKDLRTLIALATFMNEEGKCFPSQAYLAKVLGLTQPAAAKRVKSLLRFRWKGQPLLTAEKVRARDGRFERTIYAIHPESCLALFNPRPKKAEELPHIPAGHMAGGNPNQNQIYNKPLTWFKKLESCTPSVSLPTDPLALNLARDMEDMRNLAFYVSAVRKYPASFLLRARGLVLETKEIRKSRGAFFAHLLKVEKNEI